MSCLVMAMWTRYDPRCSLTEPILPRGGILIIRNTRKIGDEGGDEFVTRRGLINPPAVEAGRLSALRTWPRKQRKDKNVNKLKRLFSPRALAGTVGTAMLVHATLAWAATNCLSVPVSNGAGCGGSYPVQCSEASGDIFSQPPVDGANGCAQLHNWTTFYWCCPSGESCGQLGGVDNPPNPYACWGWCQCGGG